MGNKTTLRQLAGDTDVTTDVTSKRGLHPNSLANLKPARRGDVRNPRGVNGVTKDAARRAKFAAVCLALEACEDPDEGQRLLHHITEDILDGAVAGDSRLLLRVCRFLLG